MIFSRIRQALFYAVAWIALLLIRTLLRRLGYRRTVRLLAKLSPHPARNHCTPRMMIAARSIERVDSWWPRHPNGCLRRSLYFWWVFRWFGYDCEVRTGIRRKDGKIDLHAWVQCGGRVVNDDPTLIEQYTVLWNDLSSRVIAAGVLR